MSRRALAAILVTLAACPSQDPVAPPVVDAGSDAAVDAGPTPCKRDADCAHLATSCAKPSCDDVCVTTAINELGVCDDGLFCTDNDACHDGVCTGMSAHVCTSSDACHVGACDEDQRACLNVAGNEGAQCPAVDACHALGKCTAGACEENGSIDCSMFNGPCTLGQCALPGGCYAKPINEALPCDDGKGSACSFGRCASGLCQSMVTNEGGPCDDGQFCTVGDTCAAGACVGAPNPCAPPGGCFDATCDEGNKTCHVQARPDGTVCDDGSPCTASTTCLAGSCSGGVAANEGAACDDGSTCTSGEHCVAGTCSGGAGPVVYFADTFVDNSRGWTLGPEWQIGAATASIGSLVGADPAYDHSPSPDNGVAGVVLGGNATTLVHAPYYLESPPFDASGASPVILGFYRWLNADHAPYMTHDVEVFDGAAWVVIWKSGDVVIEDSPPAGAGWTFTSFDVTAHRSGAMRVRFGVSIVTPGALAVGSWNLDDLLVASEACP